MACPICGANCRCKKRGPGGICCGCHKHKAQRGFTRGQLNDWRASHSLDAVTDAQWNKQFAKADDRPQIMLPEMAAPSFGVGDLVVVGKASGVNPANALAVVVDAYELRNRPGWMLLFKDGRYDGFSPDDCALFGVTKIGHAPSIADYRFRNVMWLSREWREGRFAEAWRS